MAPWPLPLTKATVVPVAVTLAFAAGMAAIAVWRFSATDVKVGDE